MEDVFDDTEDTREEDRDKENLVAEDGEKVEQLQAEIESLQVFCLSEQGEVEGARNWPD